MVAKPKPTGNKILDLWHLECWKAEKAHQDVLDALDNCPANTSQLELSEVKNNLRISILKIQELCDHLPYGSWSEAAGKV